MTQKRTIFIFLCALMGPCCLLPRDVIAQSTVPVTADGTSSVVPANIEAVLFYSCPQKLTLKQIEKQWEQIPCQEYVIRQMGPVRHERILEFLYRVAIFDPSLYKTKPYRHLSNGKFALENMLWMKHPALPAKLAAILGASFVDVPVEQVRKIKGIAAQELLRYKDSDAKLAFEVLDKNAQDGDVFCPYLDSTIQRQNGWIGSPIELEARKHVRKWLDLQNQVTRLEAASCAVTAGIVDARIRELAEGEVGEGLTVPETPSREWRLGKSILRSLGSRGDLKAAKIYDRIQMEEEIKKLNIKNPAADKSVRDQLEKEFKKKWKD